VPLPFTVNESTKTEQFFREKKEKQYKMRDMVRKFTFIILGSEIDKRKIEIGS
jgi:hypothetical protein